MATSPVGQSEEGSDFPTEPFSDPINYVNPADIDWSNVDYSERFVPCMPSIAPGQCGLCGSSATDRTFVDTRLSFDFFGQLYICDRCAWALASALNNLPLLSDPPVGLVDSLTAENIQLKEVIANGILALARPVSQQAITDAIRSTTRVPEQAAVESAGDDQPVIVRLDLSTKQSFGKRSNGLTIPTDDGTDRDTDGISL